MELKLESGLLHQEYAVKAVSDVFDCVRTDWDVAHYSNPVINLRSSVLLGNILGVQRRETQNVAEKYRSNNKSVGIPLCLDIKMETGTGKTYVYTNAIFELHKLYGINKFIIAVPSIAIKAGTSAFLNEAYVKTHFKNTLGYDTEINVSVLETVKKQKKGRKYFPTAVRAFVEGSRLNTNKIYVLIVNSALLTTGKMLTRNDYDVTVEGCDRPFDALRLTRPFVIIDEPHTFSRDQKAYKAIVSELAPQCIIRFGATFPMVAVGKGKKKTMVRDYEHLLYDLNAQQSFSSGLIKGVMKEHFEPTSSVNEKVKILSIDDKKATLQHITQTSKKSCTLSVGDSLSIICSELTGLTITGITKDLVILSNGTEKHKNDEFDVDIYTSSYQESMLRLAIQRHFETERANFHREKGRIKTLSLFFIDDIVSFRGDDKGANAWLRDLFDRLLEERLKSELEKDNSSEYAAYLTASLNDIAACRAGYFAQDNSDSDEAVKKEVDDILHNKTELLSFTDGKGRANTRRFLFSKWTLKEGWDNPNVFTIAKLRSSGSENSKLQEVGRGLRLPVDEYGNRVKDESFYLNYIVDFTERDFADRLVMEINEDIQKGSLTHVSLEDMRRVAALRGMDEMELLMELYRKKYVLDLERKLDQTKVMDLFAEYPEFNNVTGKVKDRNKGTKDMVKIRKARYDELKELWAQLNRKYIIFYQNDIDRQIETALPDILANDVFVHQTLKSSRHMVTTDNGQAVTMLQSGQQYVLAGKEMHYNEFLKRICRQTSIPMTMLHSAICEYAKTHTLDGYINESSMSAFIAKFNGWKIKNLQNLVKYRQANYSSKSTAFTNADGSLKEEVLQWTIGKNVLSAEPSKKYLYDKVVYDSPLERENIMNEVDSVIVYGKIPQKSICIPNITNDLYSPDFMYVVKRADGKKELNIVIETKDIPNDEAKRTVEDAKINNAERFFQQLRLDGFDVKFHRQLQNKNMINIIGELLEEDTAYS
ncbi:MAG: type III restriction-modification system endonuclease [Bacteroides sp.]|nr:type III restriction-modification system endonuclease [Roseburia sp.]MCM1346257.1 type III restriction-modification system endonuclease [Bacteroides sp.]MCM1420830.1 type III restriction-modification system endonuclease [Bacteroides sp.]